MARPLKIVEGMPLRQYWAAINRGDRQEREQKRAHRKSLDQRRPACRCQAFPWPHRPGSGFCRAPESPVACLLPKKHWRPHRRRYTGILRQLCRSSGLHPIRDRKLIDQIMPTARMYIAQLRQQCPALKYRNIRIKVVKGKEGIRLGFEAYATDAGPDEDWDG